MKARADWPIAFFDEDYLRIYGPMFTEERTREEIDFIESSLGLPAGGSVLDLACGIGRHAIGMALRGYRLTGFDFNPRYLEIAEREAERRGTRASWVAGDMRALDFENAFDGVYSFFTSFGYYSDAENELVLGNVARALKPGGRFLLDMANRDWILTHPQERSWKQREDGALLMEESALDLVTSRVTQRQILIEPQGGPRVTKEFILRVYTCAELVALLARHGLLARGAWGGIDRGEHTAESRRTILVAERDSTLGGGA